MPYPDTPTPSGETRSDGRPMATPAAAEDTLRDDAKTVVSSARDDIDKVTSEAKRQAGKLADEAQSQIHDVAERAKGLAAEQKDLVAGQIGGVADAMSKVAGELEQNNASSAQYARMIADGANRISDTVRDNDVDSILAMAQDFGRRQPAAFMGAAALLGFAASRFVMASAKREDTRKLASSGSGVDYNGLPQQGDAPQGDYGTSPGNGSGTDAGTDYPTAGRV